MTAFRFEAARADGGSVRGVLDVASEADAAAVLSGRGLFPLSVRPLRTSGWRTRRPSARARATVFQSLASLVGAGVPLEKALSATEQLASGALRDALHRVAIQVREGTSLGSALRADEEHWTGVTIGLVRAGENGAGLAAALDQAATQLEREAETVARIRVALAYPLLLLFVGMLSVIVIVGFVVPRFVALLSDLGQALPLTTRVLIGAADLARRFGLLLGVAATACALAARRVIEGQRARWHSWLLTLPVVGPLRHGFATARSARSLSALLGSGTPALAALAIAEESSGDAAIAGRLARARELVAQGTPLSVSLARTEAMTEGALQLVTIGEGSGRVAHLLAKAAELQEREAERRLQTLVSFLEPALILTFAAIVAFVAAALLQAVYSLRPGGV